MQFPKWIVGASECHSPTCCLLCSRHFVSDASTQCVLRTLPWSGSGKAFVFFCVVFPWNTHNPKGLQPELWRVQRLLIWDSDRTLRAGKNTSLWPAGTGREGHATFHSAGSGPLKLRVNTVARVKWVARGDSRSYQSKVPSISLTC